MKPLPVLIAPLLVLGALGARAGELPTEQKTDAPRAASVQDDVKLNQNRGDVRLDRQTSDVKAKPAGSKIAKSKAKKPKKKRRSLKDMPGALVR